MQSKSIEIAIFMLPCDNLAAAHKTPMLIKTLLRLAAACLKYLAKDRPPPYRSLNIMRINSFQRIEIKPLQGSSCIKKQRVSM